MIEEEIRQLKAELANLKEYVDLILRNEMHTETWYKLRMVQERLEEHSVALADVGDERRR